MREAERRSSRKRLQVRHLVEAHAVLDAVLARVAGEVDGAGHGHAAVGGGAVQGLLVPGHAPNQVVPCTHSIGSCAVKQLPCTSRVLQAVAACTTVQADIQAGILNIAMLPDQGRPCVHTFRSHPCQTGVQHIRVPQSCEQHTC